MIAEFGKKKNFIKWFVEMVKTFSNLKNIYINQDVYVIAAGASMNYIDGSFFENKNVIGVNRVCMKFPCDFIVAKDGRGFGKILEHLQGQKNTYGKLSDIVLSKHESGNHWQGYNHVEYPHYIFDHAFKNSNESPDLNTIKKDSEKIVVSYSTITSAIHIAAYMGAKNIILCGHDCGTINGSSTIDNYYNDEITPVQGTQDGYVKWLGKIEKHTIDVVGKVRDEFGCNVHSLNPFINFNLEGHKFSPS